MFVPHTQKEVRGFMGWLNYISRFISHLTNMCDLIFKLMKKHDYAERNEDIQKAFDRVKKYLSNPLNRQIEGLREPGQVRECDYM